jgi:hypothetical protein
MRTCLLLFLLLPSVGAFSQLNPDSLINEGIDLHKRGYFEEAIKKYEEVLRADPMHYRANYEKSYSLYELGKFEECINICRFLLRQHKENPQNKNLWVIYGSVLDYSKMPDDAIRAFDEGLKQFPHYYLLHFNKAITLYNLGRDEEAEKSLQLALRDHPLHNSSHHLLGILHKDKNKMVSLMASACFLAISPSGERAVHNLKNVTEILGANVSRTGDKTISIFLNPPAKESKKKKENDFSMVEISLSLARALDFDEQHDQEKPLERLKRKMEMMTASLRNGLKKGKGFYWHFYAPFFIKLYNDNWLDVYCRLAVAHTDDKENNQWLVQNNDTITRFYDWLDAYKWFR